MTNVRRMISRSVLMAAIGLGCSITLSASQTAPVTPACKPWVESGGGHDNRETPQLGCANRRNLESVLDKRDDLTLGRTLGPADAERESMAVQNYEQSKVKESGTAAATPGALLIPSTTSQGNAQ